MWGEKKRNPDSAHRKYLQFGLNFLVVTILTTGGPRPAAKDQMAITRGGDYAVASTVAPGLSGPAALYDYIYGDTIEDEKEYEEKVLPTRLALEVYYVHHRSAFYDIKMIWYTVVCILCSVFGKEPKKIFNELLESAKEMQPAEQPVVTL